MKKKKINKNTTKKDYNQLYNLHVSKHAIERYKQRSDCYGMKDDKIISRVKHNLETARIIGIRGKETHYINRGYIYVVITETVNGLERNTVSTIMLNKQKQLELWASDIDHIDKDAIYT